MPSPRSPRRAAFARLVSLALFVALAACQRHAVPDAAGSAPTPNSDVQRFRPITSSQTQVALFVVPRSFAPTGWTTGDAIAGAIAAFEPDLILVDAPPDALAAVVAGARPDPTAAPWSLAPEVLTTLLPLAGQLDVPILGISAWSEGAADDRRAYDLTEPHGPPHREFLLARARAQSRVLEHRAAGEPDWAYDAALDPLLRAEALWLAYYAEHRMRRGGVLRLLSREAGHIEDALDDARGQRVAIVIPLQDRFYQQMAIELRDDAVLVPVEPLFR